MIDSWRLALGTFTAIRVRPPHAVDRRTAGGAMFLAPLAALPLGILCALVLWAGNLLELFPWAVAMVAVGALALGSRAFHLDGLADTADGLTASYDRERSLQVMKSGAAGPAGVVAIVVVLGVQAAAFTTLLSGRGPLLAAALVCASRGVVVLGCLTGVPPARADGLAVTFAGTVPRAAAAATWALLLLASWPLFWWVGLAGWRGPVALIAALAVVSVLLTRCVRRFGGVTGDVLGAMIETALAVLLIAAT